MKKTIRTILCAAAFSVLAVSCQKEINEVEPVSATRGTIEVNVNGLMGEYTQVDATKSELVNTVRVAWEGGDSVYVYDGTKYLGSLASALDGNDNRYAVLSGTIDSPTGNKLYLVHSPLLTEAPAIDGGKLSVSLAEQTSLKAPFVVFASLDYTDGNITNAIVPFTFTTSVVRVNCTGLEPNTAISSAEISSVNASCVLTFVDGDVTTSGAEEGTITRSNADGFGQTKVNAEGDASFQFAVPALATSTGRILTVKQGDDEYIDDNFSKSSINPNLSVNTICTMRSKDSITPDSPIGTIGTIGGRKAMVVNLYGTKYAVALMNEGATAESGTGSYGKYVDYDEASSFFHGSDLNVWRVPSMDEMQALADNTREYDSTTPAVKFTLAGGSISFPLVGVNKKDGIAEFGNGEYYTSTPVEGSECYYICLMLSDSDNGKPYVGYEANPVPDLFKLSLRLFYQLTETNTDVLHGRFTVNADGKQVYFSKGNLQATYYDSAYTWGFAENQYDILGEYNSIGRELDLFGWSTVQTYYGITSSTNNADYKGNFLDWGNALGSNIWRTLSIGEWEYLVGTRIVQGESGFGHTCAWATINDVKGLIIFCDDYIGSTDNLDSIPDGCVFLPSAGQRVQTDTDPVTQTKYENNGYIVYWSATPVIPNNASNFRIEPNPTDEYYSFIGTSTRNFGYAVRLVTDCE